MARKKKQPEHFNHERWLVSYADFITLLFAFFTTMYAISTVDAQKMGKMVMSMKASFDGSVFPEGSRSLSLVERTGSSGAPGQNLIDRIQAGPGREFSVGHIQELKPDLAPTWSLGDPGGLSRLKRAVDSVLSVELSAGKIRTYMEPRGLIVSLGEGGFFDSGSDQLKPEGRAVLDTLATSLMGAGNLLRVEGHTDNVPIRTVRFPSNWELSTARATTLVSYLVTHFGFTPERLSAAGYGEFKPVATNDTVEGRARNRRVDLVVLDPRMAVSEPR